MTGFGIFFLILFSIFIGIVIAYNTHKHIEWLISLIKPLLNSLIKPIKEFISKRKQKQMIKDETLAEKNKTEFLDNSNIKNLGILEIQNAYKKELTYINNNEQEKTIAIFDKNCPYFKKYFIKSIHNFYKKNGDKFETLCEETLNEEQKGKSIIKSCISKLTEDWHNYNLLLTTICNDIDNFLYSTDIDSIINQNNKILINDKSDNLYNIAKKITCYNTDDLTKINNGIHDTIYTNMTEYGKYFLLYANPDDINDMEKIEYDTLNQ